MTVSPQSMSTLMASRGEGRERAGTEHRLSETDQGKYHYTIGPYSDPVLTVAPGDRIVIETRDAFDGAVATEEHLPSQTIRLPFTNPQNGPILIESAEKGDALAVEIESIEPRGEQPRGTICLIPEFGALAGVGTLNDPLPEIVRKIWVDRSSVRWSPRIDIPFRPHIGTLSCSPEIDSVNTLTPDNHGGNMDLPDMGPGSITYLPVRVPGARLFVGDAHACQGDGEVCGVAMEIASTTTIRVDVIKGWTLEWPRLETADLIMSIASARPLDEACRLAYRDLVRWMSTDHGFDALEAYMLLSLVGRVRVGNVVDPKFTISAGIPRHYLNP